MNGFTDAMTTAGKVELNVLGIGLGGASAIEGLGAITEAETTLQGLLATTKLVTGTLAVGEGTANLIGAKFPESISISNLVASTPLDIFGRDWPSIGLDTLAWIEKYNSMMEEKKKGKECP